MLLPLLGACAVVGPFWGPEWEPVRGLLSEDRSCRDPRCCGNLLVLCLFLIWQVRHYWHQVTRTHHSVRKFLKVPPQKWAVPSMRHDTCFRLAPKFFLSPGKFRGLDAHARQWAQSKSREYWRSLEESWTQHLLSCQRPCQGVLWDAYTSSDRIFCTTSFSSTSMLPRDSSWEVWQVPWCCSDGQTDLICRPRPPALDRCQRMEQLLVHPQEELAPLEYIVNMRCHPTSMTPVPNLPSAQSLPFCSREFLAVPSNQQVGMPTWKSWGCPHEVCAPGTENLTLSREASRETQAPGCANQKESRGDNAWEIQAPGRQLPINFGMEDMAESKVLDWGSQRLVISKAVGEILTPWWENQDQVQVESRVEIQELWKRSPGETGGENLPETQVCRGEKVEQLRCKIDAETQTPMWETQDRKRDKDAIETQSFENKKEARGEDEEKNEAQVLRKQGQTGSEDGEDTQLPGWGKQDQITGDTSTEIQAEERRKEDQGGGENAVQIQISGKENLGEVKNEDGIETQALGWGKQEWVQNENVTEIQTPGWEKRDQDGSEKAGKIQVCRAEIQKQLRHELQVGWSNQGIKRGDDAGESQISRRNNLREIREEDWVVIRAQCWGDQKPVASEIDREFKTPCWGSEDQIGGEHRAEIQALEKRDQGKDRDDDTNTLAPEAENQRQIRGVTWAETHPSGMRNQEQFGDETRTDIQATGKKNLGEVKGEDSKETQELREENQYQLNSEINGNIHIPKWKNQEHIRSKDGKNTQASEAENWGELASKIDVETNSAQWKKEEQVGGENGAEIQAPEKRNQREAGGEDGIETWTPGEENQSQLRDDTDEKTHLSDRKNHQQMGGENETEIQTPENTDQREPGGEDDVETQRLERENEGQLDGETGLSHPPGGRNWEQTRGMDNPEDPTMEKKSQREVGSKSGRNIQRLGGGKQTLLKSKVNENSCPPEWKNQEQTGGENGAEIQIQGKSNLRGITGDDGKETQAHGGEYQGELRSETDEEIQIQGQGNQSKCEEDAAEIGDVGSQRKCRAEDAGSLRVPRQGNKGQVRGKDAAECPLRVDCFGGEGPPALTGSDYGAMDQEQAMTAAPHPEMKALPDQSELFLLASGEGEHLAGQSTATTAKPRVDVVPASRQARPKPQRSRQRDRRVDPGKTNDRTGQLRNPHSLAAPLSLPSACPSVSCGHAPPAATAPLGGPTALTVLPKWPVLKKSQRQLLESLMRRKIAHLKWGLPQRILESYLHFNVLGPRPLPLAGQRLPGLHMACELQGQQESEAQGSRPGLKSQKVRPPEGKSSKPATQARALEKPRPCGSEPIGGSIPPVKPKRVRPPGGARESQDVQKAAPPRVELTASRNRRPAAESSSWCGQERVQETSSENSRGRKMVRLGISRMAERASRRVRVSYPRAGYDHWRREHSSQKPLRVQGQQLSQRRGSLGPEERRGAGQQPSSCSTDTFSFKRSLHSAAARLSMTFLNKSSRSPHLAKAQHSAPNLSVRDPGPTLLPRVGDPHAREGNIRVHTPLKRDLQPPGHCGAGAPLLKTEELEEIENPHGALWNPPAPRKSGFMKYLRDFLLQHGFRK
ncbi:uncharacterized protein [Odocoileus virginianus]|uniref:Uncharacterized protein n=1 Tax=Odocoileus virginianus TaxID=9874 RepID=A0A6J0W4C1_ODOVR